MKATDGQLGHGSRDTQAGTALQVTSFFHCATKVFLSNHVPSSKTGNSLWEKYLQCFKKRRKEKEEKRKTVSNCLKLARQHWGSRRNHTDRSQPLLTLRSSRAKREMTGLEASDALAVPGLC